MSLPQKPDAQTVPVNKPSRVIMASLVGTTIEFYDFYVYATAALLTMGIATVLIGLLPTYESVGWWAPLMLVILRLAQGFALGGEWSGAALVATENAPKGKRALYGTFPQLGAPLGFILANGLFLIVAALLPSDDPTRPSDAFLDWGWRIPFLFSAIMVIVGLWVRMTLVESAAFTKAVDKGKVVKLPLGEVCRKYWRELILGTFYMFATYVLFYLMTTFSLSYGRAPVEPGEGQLAGLGYSYNTFVLMLIAGVVFFGIFTLLSGPWADRFGRRKTLMVVSTGIIVFGLSWVPLLSGGFPGVMLWLILGFCLMGATFGPMGALLPELFPTNVRYTGSGISYNVSSIIGAAAAPFIAVWLWAKGDGSPALVGIYLAIAGAITLLALFLGKETKDASIER